MSFKEQVALVTGASGGIGRAICQALASRGAAVAVHYRSRRAEAGQLVEELRQTGVRAEFYRADLADAAQARSLVARAVAEMGRLDLLVNNAGITIGGRDAVEVSPEEWRQVMDANLNSAFYTCRAAIPHLRARGGGAIVNIASNIVNSLPGGSAAYATSKAGLVALSKVLSKEEARHGIRINALSPGIIEAGMGLGALERRPPEVRKHFLSTIPMGRPGTAEEVASAVLFLLSEEASYVTGQHLTVNGGDRTESYQ